jgi:hypothetical protein
LPTVAAKVMTMDTLGAGSGKNRTQAERSVLLDDVAVMIANTEILEQSGFTYNTDKATAPGTVKYRNAYPEGTHYDFK